MKDHIRYDVLARDAMRGVLRRVLEDAAKQGLPGDHHFYITFLTQAEGVKLSPRLLAQYPNEMTIILQHQFWDLVVTEERFEVGLSFGSVPEKLVVPFAAIKAFLDPSVQFSLQFQTGEEAAGEAPAGNAPTAATPEVVEKAKTDAKAQEKAQEKAKGKAQEKVQDKAPEKSKETAQDTEAKPSEGGAEVVRLDRFRKK